MRTSLLLALLAATPALAQDAERPVLYRPVTEIEFDRLDLDVPIVKPEGVLIGEVARPRFNPLIRLRTSWDPELKGSVGLVE